jgi:glutamate N-acetyltransferase/amino-acid N-acetyltransferase
VDYYKEKQMHIECPGGITAAKGFQATGVHCGIKKAKKDLALVYSTVPARAAGVFTTSKVQAAPVMVDKFQLDTSPTFRALVVNSGNANACTGERGLNDAWTMAESTAAMLNVRKNEVLVSSTGVIGQYLQMDKVCAGIMDATSKLAAGGHGDAAEAIMTTDTFTKELAVRVMLDDVEVTIGGMAKGSGMIAPNMATMLGFVTTDANINAPLLHHILKKAADRSFNRISVDGDTSTNDMVLILANGLAGNKPMQSPDDPNLQIFYDALEYLLIKLSKMIVVDGEGATKFIEIEVIGAETETVAVQAAKAVANSNLVKTAINGEDANWGRILAAVGYSGIDFDPAVVEISLGNVSILGKDYSIDFSEEEAKQVLSQKEIKITVDLNQGDASASFWTCDLSKDYVAINANYRT